MKKSLFQIGLGTLFLLLLCAAPGRAQYVGCSPSELSITLDSDATPGVYTYFVTSTTQCDFTENTGVIFTDMGGVTKALVVPGSSLAASDPFVTYSATSANFDFINPAIINVGNNGILEIDCSSCMTGTVDWSIGGEEPTVAGPVAAVAAAPEPGSIPLMLCGLGALALLACFQRRKRQPSVSLL